ncbi:Uncharacterised protein [Mycobacteroides abscessus subsp. massiliense]|nr:Uncharacterised protein [Mycobacteroides abscessus subsp. massiliense]
MRLVDPAKCGGLPRKVRSETGNETVTYLTDIWIVPGHKGFLSNGQPSDCCYRSPSGRASSSAGILTFRAVLAASASRRLAAV